MSSLYSPSNYATHGSVNDSTADTTPFSSSTPISATEQNTLSAFRTSAYATDSTASHIQHRHRSAEQAKASHTADMKVYLERFDVQMAKFEK